MRFTEVAKANVSLLFVFGVIGGVIAAGYFYVWIPYQTYPPRPRFANDDRILPAPPPVIQPLKARSLPKPKAKPTPQVNALYWGTVNASIGLVLRAEPEAGAAGSGGVDFNSRVAVLKETPDKEWIFIRHMETKEQGWVRAGNLDRE
ncbi:MAG: SH3 domain-containing protein [Oscillatoriales cyanobacterium SM2_2_1]|nr:SH3 domain-containing protein [Oscillatoriales cyanobacterium SM2_2_1]